MKLRRICMLSHLRPTTNSPKYTLTLMEYFTDIEYIKCTTLYRLHFLFNVYSPTKKLRYN